VLVAVEVPLSLRDACLHPDTSPSAVVRAAQAAGFAAVEMSPRAVRWVLQEDRACRVALGRAVVPVHCPWPLRLHWSGASFRVGAQALSRELGLVAELGCRSGSVPLSSETVGDEVVERAGFLADLAARHGLNLLVEPRRGGSESAGLAQAACVVQRVARANAGMVIDAGALETGAEVSALAAVAAGMPVFVRLTAPAVAELRMPVGGMAGEVATDPGPADLVRSLLGGGYWGAVSAELSAGQVRRLPPFVAARRLIDSARMALDSCGRSGRPTVELACR
jgi:hypothetical protein